LRVAQAEALRLLGHLGAAIVTGGPFGDPKNLFYLEVPEEKLQDVRGLAPRMGYVATIEQVAIRDTNDPISRDKARWRGQRYDLELVYEADSEAIREQSPDRRPFVLPTENGLRHVVGYRGDSGKMSRRGLPVVDGKMLCSLVYDPSVGRFLDPFGGAGGVLIEALAHGWEIFSTDIDPVVMYGLTFHGSRHAVADARRLPFPDGTFDAIATEPPYDRGAEAIVADAMGDLDRVLRPGGRVALLIAENHHRSVSDAAGRLPWDEEVDELIDRKGVPVRAMSWRKR
jgi:SAM-dependent methyltransferase